MIFCATLKESPVIIRLDTRKVSITDVFETKENKLPVPDTLILGTLPIENVPKLAEATLIVFATSLFVVSVPATAKSVNSTAVGSNASFAILSYTYAEFFKESDIVLLVESHI